MTTEGHPTDQPAALADVHLREGENGPAAVPTFFDEVGGTPFFEQLVHDFYVGVATDPVLKPMYPEADLGPAEHRLVMFLEQFWGGPGTYSEQRGHPRLRQRHIPFKVNPDARDRWLGHMKVAVDAANLPPLQRGILWDYLERAAFAMVNSFED